LVHTFRVAEPVCDRVHSLLSRLLRFGEALLHLNPLFPIHDR
jgi:hypothetical protein